MSLKKISKLISNKHTIKIVSLIFIVGLFFIVPTFAQSTATTSESLKGIQEGLNDILKLCSRGRVILAILAGKLMTNDWVFGSVLHMDIYLWKIWNIMKNFANFALVGIIITSILGNLIGKKDMNIKDLITKTLIAGILIQASWFLMGAVLDLSTIAVSAVGSFPSSFLASDDAGLQGYIETSLKETPARYIVNDKEGLQPIKAQPVDRSQNLDKILPSYNSISGPLVYLGFSVFKFQNYAQGSDAGTLTISFLLRTVLILFYTIGLALLFIANIIRVVFLWLFIIGSPAIILASVFKKKLGGESDSGIMKYLNLETMLDLILKPVIFVAGFALILIFVVSIQSIMQGTLPQQFNGINISVNTSGALLDVEGISSIQVNEGNSILGGSSSMSGEAIAVGQTIFVNLIIFFLTIFLIRQFIKISVTSGKGPIADVMKPITKFIEDFATTMPIFPGGASLTALKTTTQQNKKKLAEGFGFNTQGQFGERDKDSKTFETNETKFNRFLTDKMGMQEQWAPEDYTALDTLATAQNIMGYLDKLSDLSQTRAKGLSINDTRWLGSFQKIANVGNTFQGTLATTDEKGLEVFFNTTKGSISNAEIFYNLLGGSSNVLGSNKTKPTSYAQLKLITFGVPSK